jgi:hypothetical protein
VDEMLELEEDEVVVGEWTLQGNVCTALIVV